MTLGAGVEYHFSPRFALDLGLTHSRGRFNEAVLHDRGAAFRQKFTSNRVQMGFTWRP
jgi:opacity protein-like surface antigen